MQPWKLSILLWNWSHDLGNAVGTSLPTAIEIVWQQAKNISGQFSSDFRSSLQTAWASFCKLMIRMGLSANCDKRSFKISDEVADSLNKYQSGWPLLFLKFSFFLLSSHLNLHMNVNCNIIYVIDYKLWLQSVLSINHCKGAAASANQEGLKPSINKHINLIVFIHLLSRCRGGDYYWNSSLILGNMFPRSRLLSMEQSASPKVAKATKRKERQGKQTFYTEFKLQCHWNQDL